MEGFDCTCVIQYSFGTIPIRWDSWLRSVVCHRCSHGGMRCTQLAHQRYEVIQWNYIPCSCAPVSCYFEIAIILYHKTFKEGNFPELVEIQINFSRIAHLPTNDTTLQNLAEKTFHKIFNSRSFPLYGIVHQLELRPVFQRNIVTVCTCLLSYVYNQLLFSVSASYRLVSTMHFYSLDIVVSRHS